MKNIFFLFAFIFPYTNQLLCLSNCHTSKFTADQLSEDSTSSKYRAMCKKTIQKKCYGRIMVYYKRDTDPEFISYSLGSENHIVEIEMERIANIHLLKYIIHFIFIFESNQIEQLVLTAYILCETHDDCALDYIKKFFHLYRTQTNPFNALHPYFAITRLTDKLSCYDYKRQKTLECASAENARCILKNQDVSQRQCYSDSNRLIEFAFTITSEVHSLKKLHRLIVCDARDCNGISAIREIEKIIYDHAFGTIFNVTDSHGIRLHSIIYSITMFQFFLMIFQMIF